MANTTRLTLPLLATAQAQKSQTHNDALGVIDALVQPVVVNSTTTAPPGTPAEGDCYIIAATATGAWAGKETQIAHYLNGAWAYYVPAQGWVVNDINAGNQVEFNGAAWAAISGGGGGGGTFVSLTDTPANFTGAALQYARVNAGETALEFTAAAGGGVQATGQAYRTTAYNLAALNTWYDIPLDGGNKNLVNVSHSTVTNPTRLTIDITDTFVFQYKVQMLVNGVPRQMVSRLLKNGGTEITGSFCEKSVSAANETVHMDGFSVESMTATDYVTLQVGTNGLATNEVDVYNDGNLPNPTTTIYATLMAYKV